MMESMEAATAFQALSQETRVRLLRLLAHAGAGGLRAGELQARLAVPASTLSFHLAALAQAGLLRSRKRGRTVTYAVSGSGLRDLLGYVAETCCAGRPGLRHDLARLLPDEETEQPTMTAAFNVLFLCTHNSARSIMAEAILEKAGRGRFRAYSAGSDPVPELHPEVVETLRRVGHDTERLHSKSWNEFTGTAAPRMDFIIALCDTTTGQVCPEFDGWALTASWPLPDPAKFTGSASERGVLVNQLYSMLRRRLDIFCSLPFERLDRMALKARLDEIGYSTPTLA
jgi:protein-tyrosine-phosphatase/DNA-binding transcriptional ArsR family regulator